MRPHALAIAAVLALSGCLGGATQVRQADPCEAAPDPTVLSAQDELLIAPDRDYHLRLVGNGWGRLLLDLCKPMLFAVTATSAGPSSQPASHSAVFLFREGEAPDARRPLLLSWAIPRSPSMCDAAVSVPPAATNLLLPFVTASKNVSGRFVVVASAALTTIELRIATGLNHRDIAGDWQLYDHPESQVRIPTGMSPVTSPTTVPPRLYQREWRDAFDPVVPSLVYVSGWHRRQGPAAGQYWDTASARMVGAMAGSFSREGTLACQPLANSGYHFTWPIDNLDAEPILVERRYAETASLPTTPILGVATLNIPLEPVAAPPG